MPGQAGISISEEWFCSGNCFEKAAHDKLSGLISTLRAKQPPRHQRIPLGLAMVSRGHLTAEQLRIVLEEQRKGGSNLGEIVQRLGFATAEQVTAAVAEQWSCPVFSLKDRELVQPVHIPRRLLELYEMLPVHFSEVGRRLMVGFVRRVPYHVLHTIEHMTACVATPCFITAQQYQNHLHSSALAERADEVHFEPGSSPSEMARLARNYVSQVGATKVRFGMCPDYLWIRLWGPADELDLLFQLQQDKKPIPG
jgi:hypothetical protein